MRDVLQSLERWSAEGRRFALATVIDTWGSSPRPTGSVMAVRDDGLVCGSVSGGCVEGAVIQEAMAALKDGRPRRLKFGAADAQTLWEVGLACGGGIEVFVEPDPDRQKPHLWQEIVAQIRNNERCAVTIDLATGERLNGIEPAPDRFVQEFPPRERLLIFGASHIAVPLVGLAKTLGFESVLADPRSQLLVLERFPVPPDRTLPMWPDEALRQVDLTPDTFAVVLSHDPKIDDAALAILLRSPVAYIGALGSRTTQAKRRQDLAALGFTEEELDRIHGPVGLEIGAATPEEIALSIAAQIVQVRRAPR
ncbi:MAG TPA: XdhC family protein [Fimbriimonas sp.]